METHWFSLHVFIFDSGQALRFLREWLTPQIKNLIQQKLIVHWFFIRYWDGGPHLRLRFAVRQLSDLVNFQRQLGDIMGAYQSVRPLTREAYYGAHKFDGDVVNVESLAWYGDGAVVPIDYEPETVRYGGQRALRVNERLFHVSSNIALRLCAATDRTQQQHLAAAMLLMAAGYLAFDKSWSHASSFFGNYASYWRRYSETAAAAELAAGEKADHSLMRKLQSLVSAIDGGGSVPMIEAVWAGELRGAVADFEAIYRAGELLMPATGNVVANSDEYVAAVEQMLSSQMHMMNNRLGVLPQQECFLARSLANAFRELS